MRGGPPGSHRQGLRASTVRGKAEHRGAVVRVITSNTRLIALNSACRGSSQTISKVLHSSTRCHFTNKPKALSLMFLSIFTEITTMTWLCPLPLPFPQLKPQSSTMKDGDLTNESCSQELHCLQSQSSHILVNFYSYSNPVSSKFSFSCMLSRLGIQGKV